jgi:uncharacterized protein YeaO (DUF488 family)
MPIARKRAYESLSRADGCRILVDRLWPRGVAKQDARIDLWCKDLAPSTALQRLLERIQAGVDGRGRQPADRDHREPGPRVAP